MFKFHFRLRLKEKRTFYCCDFSFPSWHPPNNKMVIIIKTSLRTHTHTHTNIYIYTLYCAYTNHNEWRLLSLRWNRRRKKNPYKRCRIERSRSRAPVCVRLDRVECRNPLFRSCQRPWFNFMFQTMATVAAAAAAVVILYVLLYSAAVVYNNRRGYNDFARPSFALTCATWLLLIIANVRLNNTFYERQY